MLAARYELIEAGRDASFAWFEMPLMNALAFVFVFPLNLVFAGLTKAIGAKGSLAVLRNPLRLR